MCGLSGAGKTTLARSVKSKLDIQGIGAEVIDGDDYRKTLCKDLGFSKENRLENIRRLVAVAGTFSDNGVVSIVSAINPYSELRKELKTLYRNVKLIHVDCPLHVLIERDTKGLYQKALLPEGHPEKITNLTGVNDAFDVPGNPDLYINTTEALEKC